MAVDLRKVKKLIELAEESALAELEVSSGDESVRIVMSRVSGAATVVTPAPVTPAVAVTQSATPDVLLTTIDAPMAGTFYQASNPQADPYVVLGSVVSPGDVLCIIESMKMMHEIRAASGGVVAQICVDNGQPIGTGDVLFKLK